MLSNLLHFVAFVTVAYLTTCLSVRPSGERARSRVRSAASDVLRH